MCYENSDFLMYMVSHDWNPNIEETETKELQKLPGHPGLHIEYQTLPQKAKKILYVLV